ncbi:hypothetical protein C4577_01965 [Candidatus Parcubacteria bacterium]|nr:MAG: hypothetical protein C4577_01965 [Candidatus Parcubacteria bacterium]
MDTFSKSINNKNKIAHWWGSDPSMDLIFHRNGILQVWKGDDPDKYLEKQYIDATMDNAIELADTLSLVRVIYIDENTGY